MNNRDKVTMQNGRMMVTKNGKMLPMDMNITMSEGTVVTLDGTIRMTDGTMRRLMDGESMTMDGRMADPEMERYR